MGSQEIAVNTRVIVKTFQLGCGGNFKQILVAGLILRQQHQVGGFFVVLRNAVFHRPGRQIGFNPNNGLNVCCFGSFVKVNHTKHSAMVGNGDGGHLQFFGATDQLLDIAEAI